MQLEKKPVKGIEMVIEGKWIRKKKELGWENYGKGF